MAKYFIEDSTLTGIASAIRTKTGTNGTMTPLQMPDKIADVYTAGYDAGETAGESAGYTTGYNAGVTAGYEDGYDAGEAAGDSAGYSRGYAAGESAGDSAGYTRGYNAGVTDGKSQAVTSGKTVYGTYSAMTTGITFTFSTAGTYKILASVLRKNASSSSYTTQTAYEPTYTTGGSGVSVSASYSSSTYVKTYTVTKTGTSNGTVNVYYSASSGNYRWSLSAFVCGPASVTIS